MKKVLLIIDSLGIGGAERAVINLSNGFLKKNFVVDLIVIDNIIKLSPPKEINMHILNFKKSFLDYTKYSKKLHTLIYNLENKNQKEFDLILVNLQKSTKLMKNFNHKNTYHIIRNTLSKSAFKNRKGLQLYLKKRKLKNIYNNLNLITLANGIQNDLINNINVSPKSIQTINNSININFIKEQSKETPSIKISDDYIIHVGRFSPQKRHDILIKAFYKSNINAKLILLGDGSSKKNILKLIKDLNLEDKVLLLGFKENPYPYIKNAKLLVLSSDYEGMPNVLIESIALKTPAVSTNCPSGPSEILENEYSKYLVEINNIDKLSDMIKKVYNEPYTINDTVINKFLLDNIIDKYTKLIK